MNFAYLLWIYPEAYGERWRRWWQTTVFCTEKSQSVWEHCIFTLDLSTGIWKEVEEMVADYSVLYGEIAVLVGPVYNDDATALWQGRTNNTRYVNTCFISRLKRAWSCKFII